MRKPFLIAGFTAISLGAAAIYWGQIIAPSVIAGYSDKVQVMLIPVISSEARTQTGSQVNSGMTNSNIPKYSGQALGYLGDPKIIVNYPAEFINRYQAQLKNVVSLSLQYPNSEVYWIEAGIIKKQFDNYAGARDAWEYARILNPNNATAYYNLGNLYSLYLPDFSKAESNYQKSLLLDPYQSQTYLALAEFYKEFYKDKDYLAEAILLEGLRRMPNDLNLNLTLAVYYKSVGNKEGAIQYFEKFLKFPGLTGAQVDSVKKELDQLRSS